MTADKVETHLRQVDLTRLDATNRSATLHQLIGEINALPPDERLRYRQDGQWRPVFDQMNEAEKSMFIEGTLPSGFQQVLKSFEKMPSEKRRQVIDETMARMRNMASPTSPPLSPALQQEVVRVGLQTYFTQGSAKAKAELAPLLDEMQQMMQKGTLFRGDR